MKRDDGFLFDVAEPFIGGATLSECRTYRYALWRGVGRLVNFVMLNPSTADETESDPTIRRCCDYASDWGFDGIIVTNLFAFRTKDPNVMRVASDPVGPENNATICRVAKESPLVVCAWGNDGAFMDRSKAILCLLRLGRIVPHALKITGKGEPVHPLYQRRDLKPFPIP